MEDKIIMGWSECEIEIGRTGSSDTMAVSLTSIGTIKDKSSTLETSDGDSLEAKKTGGKLVAKETQEGGFVLKTRIIEPTPEFEALIGVSEAEVDGEANVKTHIVDGDWSVKVTPKNVGARGIKAPLTQITYKPGWSEEEGNFADIEFAILHGAQGYWYSKFKKQGTVAAPVFSPESWETGASLSVTLTCATQGATIYYTQDGSVPTTASTQYSSAISLSATKTIKAIAVKSGMSNSAVVTKTYTKPS